MLCLQAVTDVSHMGNTGPVCSSCCCYMLPTLSYQVNMAYSCCKWSLILLNNRDFTSVGDCASYVRIVSAGEDLACPPDHDVKPQGVSVHLHFQLPNQLTLSENTWLSKPWFISHRIRKNTAVVGPICHCVSFITFQIIHSRLHCRL